MIYFDTSYIARLYLKDAGWESVRVLAATDDVACCLHGKAEVISAFNRKYREGVLLLGEWRILVEQFQKDSRSEAFQWLPLSEAVVDHVIGVYAVLPKTIALRAADAIHLGCAAENALGEIYSNDQKLLAAAPHFGLAGRNVTDSTI